MPLVKTIRGTTPRGKVLFLDLHSSRFSRKSAKRLAAAIERFVGPPKRLDLVDVQKMHVNWGDSKAPDFGESMLNRPQAVRTAVDKLATYAALKNIVRVPPYTESKEEAKRRWLDSGIKVIARKFLRSYGGNGTSVHRAGEELPDAKLYSRYCNKKYEYRVHVFDGLVIHAVRKKKRIGYTYNDLSQYIRSYGNGWVIGGLHDAEIHKDVLEQSIRAVKELGLTFGAVDVGWNSITEKATVYEVNTAPGLTKRTAYAYAAAIVHKLKR